MYRRARARDKLLPQAGKEQQLIGLRQIPAVLHVSRAITPMLLYLTPRGVCGGDSTQIEGGTLTGEYIR